MGTAKILVQIASHAWTLEAMRQACAEAKTTGASIVLVKLLPADYVAWFADDCDTYRFTEADTADIHEYEAVAASYGVPVQVRVFQYHSFEDGIVKVADALDAETVYATVPPSAVPFFHDAPLRHLEHELHQHHHALHPVALVIP
jgi:nucleotide-binding universal stress UspA family protein